MAITKMMTMSPAITTQTKITLFNNEFNLEEFNDVKEQMLDDLQDTRDFNLDPLTDEEIYDELNYCKSLEWEDFLESINNILTGNQVLFIGTIGRWNGTYQGGKVGNFIDLLDDLLKNCDETHIYIEDNKFYIMGRHHDGSNLMEVKELTTEGEDVYADWQNSYDFQDLTEQQMHAKLYSDNRYSFSPAW